MLQSDASDGNLPDDQQAPTALSAMIIWQRTEVEYDSGSQPRIAINDKGGVMEIGEVLEIHVGADTSEDLWYDLGFLETDYSVTWDKHKEFGGTYTRPAISLNDNGYAVALEGDNDLTLRYRVGKTDADKIWGPAKTYAEEGLNPAVALNNNGVVVEVEESSNKLYYRVGKLDGDNMKITGLDNPIELDEGNKPSITINDGGVVILAYEHKIHTPMETFDVLRYSIGQLQPDDTTIVWQPYSEYDDSGVNPSVAINDSGVVAQINQSSDYTLWCRVGKVNGEKNAVIWSHRQPYDYTGEEPTISINLQNTVIAAYKKSKSHKLMYCSGTAYINQ